MSPDGNKDQSFTPLPPEPNGRNKSMGEHDRIPPDLANSRQRVHCYIRRRNLPEHNTSARSRGQASGRSSSWREKEPEDLHLYSTEQPEKMKARIAVAECHRLGQATTRSLHHVLAEPQWPRSWSKDQIVALRPDPRRAQHQRIASTSSSLLS